MSHRTALRRLPVIRLSGKNLGMIGHFFGWVRKKNRAEHDFERRRQLRKYENLPLVACRRQHFWVFCMSFLVFLFSLKQGVWSWQQTISLLELTHKYPRRLHLNTPSRKTQ